MDGNNKWWFFFYDTTTGGWEFWYSDERVVPGITLNGVTLKGITLTVSISNKPGETSK